jgi:hypothetical protein
MAAEYGLRPSSARPSLASYLRIVWQRRHFIVAYATARNVSMYTEARLGQLWQVLTPLLLRDFALHAVEAQPLGYLHAVLDGVALSVEWPRRAYPGSGTVSYYYFHLKPQTVAMNHSWIPGGTAYADAARYGRAVPSRVVEPFAVLIAGYERVVYTYGPLFGLILVTGLGGVLRISRSRRGVPRLAWVPRTGSMLPWVTAIVLLVFPIAVADFDYRYLLPVLPFAGLAAGLAFAPAAPAVQP